LIFFQKTSDRLFFIARFNGGEGGMISKINFLRGETARLGFPPSQF
jgi:hypothetical protein